MVVRPTNHKERQQKRRVRIHSTRSEERMKADPEELMSPDGRAGAGRWNLVIRICAMKEIELDSSFLLLTRVIR